MKTFSCTFRPGVTATAHYTDDPPEKGKSHLIKVEWDGHPGGRWVLRPYIEWMNSVQSQLANEWGITLMYVYQTSVRWKKVQIWIFKPGQPPLRVRKPISTTPPQ